MPWIDESPKPTPVTVTGVEQTPPSAAVIPRFSEAVPGAAALAAVLVLAVLLPKFPRWLGHLRAKIQKVNEYLRTPIQ